MGKGEVELHADVKALAEAMVLKRGQLVVVPGALDDAKKKLRALPAAERKAVAADVVALLTRLLREAGKDAAPAVADLLLLAEAMLVEDAPKRA